MKKDKKTAKPNRLELPQDKSALLRPFPTKSLEDSLVIPYAIKAKNGGNSWPPSEVAKALGMGQGNKFYYLSASSRDYGLTLGTRSTKAIELAPIGREIVYATSPVQKIDAYKKAFFSVAIFKQVFDYYNGGQLPELEYLKNTLTTQFKLDETYHEEFPVVFNANLAFLNRAGADTSTAPAGDPKLQEPTQSIVMGEPTQKDALTAFVVMPFNEKTDGYTKGFFDEVLKHLITPAAVKAGFKVETANKKGSDVIQSTIIKKLDASDLVIADLTEHNPNVLFELGWRMAHDKPVALIRAKGTGPIFDVDHMLRVHDYNPSLWKSTLEQDIPALSEHIKATWDNRDKEKSYMKILSEG